MDLNDPDTRNRVKNAGRMSAVGWELGGAVIFGLLVGWWLDGRFGTAPVLALVGLLLGTAAGFLSLFRAVAKAQAEDLAAEERERKESERRGPSLDDPDRSNGGGGAS